MHPCFYDYDAFWPVHDQLKRHLLSMRDKYSYTDPDLVALYKAEAAARGDPPSRKKRYTANRNRQHSVPSFPCLPPSAPRDFAIDVGHPSMPPQQPQPQPAMWPDWHHDTDLQIQPLPQVPSTLIHPVHVQQHPSERFTFEMGSTTDNKKFLITLRDDLIAKGHSIRNVSGLS